MTLHKHGISCLSVLLSLTMAFVAEAGARTRHTFCPQFRYDTHHTGFANQVGPSVLNEVAQVDFPAVGGFLNGFFASASFGADGNIYIGSTNTYFYSLTPGGDIRWSFPCTSIVGTGGSPLVTESGMVIFGDDSGKLFCIDDEGLFQWSFATGIVPNAQAIFNGPASSFDGLLYFGDNGGKLYSLFESGTLNWSTQLSTASIYTSSATVDEELVYIGATDGYLYAVEKSGAPRWSYSLGGEIHTTPVVTDDGLIVFGSTSGQVACVNRQGLIRWSDSFPTAVTASAAYAGFDSLVLADEGGVIRKYRADGNLVWEGQLSGAIKASPVIDSDGKIYVYSEAGNIYVMDSGGIVLDWTTWGEYWKAGSSPALGPDGTLYIFSAETANTRMIAFRQPGGTGAPSLIGSVEDGDLTVGERLKYSVAFSNPARRLTVDFYVAVMFDNSLLFYPGWGPDWVYTRITLDGGASGAVTLVDMPILDSSMAGEYTFYSAAMVPETLISFGDVSVVGVTIR